MPRSLGSQRSDLVPDTEECSHFVNGLILAAAGSIQRSMQTSCDIPMHTGA